MKHLADPEFWEHFNGLPENIQQLARKNFDLLKDNPSHPSLHFKKAGRYWSARVGLNYRALAVQVDEGYLWFWIGDHKAYDRIIG